MSVRAIEVMGWHPLIPGSDSHVGMIPAGPPDLALIKRDEWDWQDRALCAQTDPEAFFPPDGQSAAAAKRVCLACEVRAACLEWAVANGIAYGVYGGMDERERRALGPQHLDFRPASRKELAA